MALGEFPQHLKDQINGEANSAHWTFESDPSGDASNNGIDLTVVGSVSIDSDNIVPNLGDRDHIYVSGVAGRLVQNGGLRQNNSTDFSLSFWYNSNTIPTTNDNYLMAQYWNFGVWNFSTGSGELTYEDTGGNNRSVIFPLPATGEWHHGVITYDTSRSQKMELFIDNVSQGFTTAAGNIESGSELFYIAANSSLNAENAAYQEISYFNDYVLTSGDVADLYNNGDGTAWNAVSSSSESRTYTAGPFGDTSSSGNPDLAVIKAFGGSVVKFDVSADWSSQAGSLSFQLIENECDGDRIEVPVIGEPFQFELKTSGGDVVFQYVGLVDSFTRNASNSKTYSVSLASPLKILDATDVILDGYLGLGGSVEGVSDFSGLAVYDFGSRNNLMNVSTNPGVNSWWNVSNLINVFGILENDDPFYRVPFQYDAFGNPILYGDYGFSGNSDDGMPLVKLMYALHLGINHLPLISDTQRQRTHGGNLLYGRHNYNVNTDQEGIPYYYHFDALGFYNQVVGILGPQYRIAGASKTLRQIITEICNEANLEFYTYIDTYTDTSIGAETLQENDPNWSQQANLSWQNLSPVKFTLGGNYGGTIRVATLSKNAFFNASRPFSNIAYNIIGLEVPDLKDEYFTSGVHPGKRPIQNSDYGLVGPGDLTYSDPLDSKGIDQESNGFTDVGAQSIASGGSFPVETGLWDPSKVDDLRIRSSNISIKSNDLVTMKVVTGGKQTRIINAPRKFLRQYWGDIILSDVNDPESIDTPTESINQTSTRKIPVVTQILDPRDVDDFIFIDMKDLFGPLSIDGVLHQGVYAASVFEIRVAMNSEQNWTTWFKDYKYLKYRGFVDHFYPDCTSPEPNGSGVREDQEEAAGKVNNQGGLGYAGCCEILDVGNVFSELNVKTFVETLDASGIVASGSGVEVSGVASASIPCTVAKYNIDKYILPRVYEQVRTIGETHYGKSWYVPVPYFKTKEDLDGKNIVGNFDRSWQLTDSAYVEPSLYYAARVPQNSQFVREGKVLPFVNYDHNFIKDGGQYDEEYASEISNPIGGLNTQIFNFSEYDLDSLCVTKYDESETIIHAAPLSIENQYSFLPYRYDNVYNRSQIPFLDIKTGLKKYYESVVQTGVAPSGFGQGSFSETRPSHDPEIQENPNSTGVADSGNTTATYDYVSTLRIPAYTIPGFLSDTVSALTSIEYEDNGRFSFPFVKVETARVFTPQTDGFNESNGLGSQQSVAAFRNFIGAGSGTRQKQMLTDQTLTYLNPFPVCVTPKTISYAQISDRHVYGPWITSLDYISFRGKVEYEQDDSLVPENFLIPTNFGQFGDFTLSQTSGLTGLDLAAQGRANAIDDFALFAVEEGSIAVPGAPAIKRVGETLYGLPQVTDMAIAVSNDNIETSYSFKTISPRFNKNNRDVERTLTKISNKLKKLDLR